MSVIKPGAGGHPGTFLPLWPETGGASVPFVRCGFHTHITKEDAAMKRFVQKHAQDVIGVLSGFDRLVFRGTIRQLAYLDGMKTYLSTRKLLLKDFGKHVQEMTKTLKGAVTAAVEKLNRPVVYLSSSAVRKEDVAREIAERDGVAEGIIALLTCVEPCWSYDIFRNREAKKLELQSRYRKCLSLYLYQIHPVLGFMHARIQSWFPFNIQVCINGREWLARQMERDGLEYQRRDNCFTWLGEPERAQKLMDKQLRTRWPRLLGSLARELNPAHKRMFGSFVAPYYWSVFQSEWATDVMFRDADALARIYPPLVRHGIQAFASPDVMRFLGKKIPAHGHVDGRFEGEVVSDMRHRPEGVRLKHRVNANSVKLYDKQGSVLRFETTINRPRDFKVYRRKEDDSNGERAWRPMRQGVADLHRRAKVSQAANDRYAEALAAVDVSTPLGQQAAGLCQPTELNGRRVRALRPWSPEDFALLKAVNQGQFVINGLRNRDLRELLCESTDSPVERRRQSARISRQLRLLRAHGLLRKIPRTHRYQLTFTGRQTITALLAAHAASTTRLADLAA